MLVKFAIQDFMDEREMMNLSESTLKAYSIFFKEFQTWLRENDILDIENVSTAHIKGYLVYCKKDRGNSPATINNKLKNLRALFNYLVECEYLTKNPCYKVVKQKTDNKIEVFTDLHIKQMLRYYRRLKRKDHEYTAYRNSAIIVTLLGTGLRIGELRNLKWFDITDTQLIIYGKNRTQESVPLTDRVKEELEDLRLYCSRYFEQMPDYIFANRNGSQMSYEATKSVFKRLQDVMGFEDVRLSAHTFRHTFAHRYIMNGGDVFSLQKILRHKSLSMTEKYLAMWGTALHAQNEKYNPLNNMDI